MSQSPARAVEFEYESDYAAAAKQLNKLVRAGRSYSGHERNCCYLNVDGDRFANASSVSGFDFPEDGRAVAVCDWDQDGAQDVWVANRTAPQLRLMRNRIGQHQHFVQFELVGTKSNRDAIGAVVRVKVAAEDAARDAASVLRRTVRAGEGFLACSSRRVHFGLGVARSIESLDVRWPNGDVEQFEVEGLIDGLFRLEEGSGKPVAVPQNSAETSIKLAATDQELLPQSFATRNLLTEAVPAPPLMYKVDESLVDAAVGSDKPILINLWATWCQPCLGEITEWSKHANELAPHVDVLPISLDAIGENKVATAKIQEILQRCGHRGDWGLATPPLADTLQMMHNVIYDHHRPLPVPTSFLLDKHGSIRAVYKGTVSVEQLLADAKQVTATDTNAGGSESYASGLPFPGRWLGTPASHKLSNVVQELFELGYETEAAAYAERLTDSRYAGSQVRSRLLIAEKLAKSDPVMAIRQLQGVIGIDPKNATAHERLGVIFARSKQPQKAFEHFQMALANTKAPQARTHFNFGRFLRSFGRPEMAIKQFSRVLEIDREFQAAHEQLGLIAAGNRKFVEAVTHFKSALEFQPNSITARVNLGMALSQLKRDADAYKTLEPLLKRDDVPPMALLLAARSLENLGQDAKSVPLLERFLTKQPNANDVRAHLQEVKAKLDRSR